MKRRGFLSLISLILAVAMMITALSSCSADNSSLILCNVKLDVDENTRSFDDIEFSNDLSALEGSTIYYTATYKGTGASYGEDTNQLYSGGILLSQGLWCIDCVFYKDGVVIATGSTDDIWVNLNTSSFVVHIGGTSGKGSALLSYKVFCSDGSVKNATCNIALSKWGTSSKEEDINRDFNIQNSTGSDNFVVQNLEIGELDSGKYLLVITINDADDNSLLFTDVIGFPVKGDCITTINGKCYVKKGTTGNNEYIYWEEDPTDLDTTQTNVVEVGGSGQQQLDNATTITTECVYVVNPDTSSSNSMTLGHTTTSSDSTNSNRIVTPASGTSFGINMQGTDVVVTIGDEGVDASKENTTIIELKEKVTMTLYNYASSSKDATWGLVEVYYTAPWPWDTKYYRRYQCNTSLVGGTLNVVGSYSSDFGINSISNGAIIFRGPVASDNVVDSINGFYKQGAINITSGLSTDSAGNAYTSTGGNVVLDGNVSVIGATGISSWEVSRKNSSINGYLDTTIKIINGASINATGDDNDNASGIYVMGNSQGGTINIILDNGTISASGSTGSSAIEAGIRIEKFTGTINIELKNGSTINSTKGYGIYLVDCTGDVTIKKDDSSTISGKNTSSTIYTSNVPKLSKNF